jgi:hypothetical protein
MTELIDVRADAIGPGEVVCLGGAAILVTTVERGPRTVDLHTCYGPALRLLHADLVSIVVPLAEDAASPANLDGATRPVRLVA